MNAKNNSENLLAGFLGSFLSKNLKTNQLEVNTDEKTLKPIARLKEPRDLFALSKDNSNDCAQQAARWPTECQVLEERVYHIESIPEIPEPYYKPTGNELKPRPVGEENGIVVFNYNPVSAVHYKLGDSDNGDSDSDSSSCSSRSSSTEREILINRIRGGGIIDPSKIHNNGTGGDGGGSNSAKDSNRKKAKYKKFSKRFQTRSSSSNSDFGNEEDDFDEYFNVEEDNDEKIRRKKQNKSKRKDNGDQNQQEEVKEEEEQLQDYYDADYFDPLPIKSKLTKVNPLKMPVINNIAQNYNILAPMNAHLHENCNNIIDNTLLESHTDHNHNHNNKSSSSSSSSSSNNSSSSMSSNNNFNNDNNNSNNKSSTLSQSSQINIISNTLESFNFDNNICNINNKHEQHHQQQQQHQNQTITTINESFNKNNYNKHNINDNNNIKSIFNDYSKLKYGFSQFSRSSVGGSKLIQFQQQQFDDIDGTTTVTGGDGSNNMNNFCNDSLEFESRFESGNLAKAVKITSTYYELYLRPDMYTNRHRQWFYFRVSNTKKNVLYRFSIVNLVKSDSLYNEGMRPLMYSNLNAKLSGIGWRRCGDNISYFKNDDEASSEEDEDNSSYTLTFNIQFPHDSDTVYFAHSYPYTYSDLQDYLMEIQNHPVKSKYCKLRLLCRSLAGNNVYYLTVTAPTTEEDEVKVRKIKFPYRWKKKAIVVSARVHPGETPSSWMMKGLMDFITGDTNAAKRLRHKFIFKLIPMLNPDGVIVGNTRSSLTGKDLNRQYRTVIRETYPSIWYTKAMIKRLIDECGVAMYCDMHAHSRAHNIFIYGCENKRQPDKKLMEQVFPLMVHKNCADKFSFENCKFKIQRSKEGTGRIVIWMLGILNSYTIEASFGGTSLGSRNGTHFSTAERLRHKIIERLLKEGSSADEPLNIPLSDYSSDEGDESSSSSSENEGKSKLSDLEGPCCQPMKVPPCTPDLDNDEKDLEMQKLRKAKLRIKTNKRKKKQVRKTLDLPTTDPGSDIQFSTDDELIDGHEAAGDGYDTIPKTRRTLLMQSDLQRKYLEGEGDISNSLKMPPELIVTPAKKKNDLLGSSLRKLYPETIPNNEKLIGISFSTNNNNNTLTEFPPISDNNSRRSHSWHTYNKSNVPKIRVQNSPSYYNSESTTENLQFKLSLKKKIWTGVNEPNASSSAERRRPLSWGIPPIIDKRDTEIIKDEQEELLIACSQKLLIWQEKEPEVRRELFQSPIRNKVTINLTVPNTKDLYERPISVKSRNKSGRSSSKLEKFDSITNDQLNKIKKKRSSQIKITESMHIFSQNHITTTTTTKIRPKSLLGARKSIGTLNATATNNSFHQNSCNTLLIPPLPKSHKFKASGLVATTTTNIQSSTNRKKRNRSIPAIKHINRDNFGTHQNNNHLEEIIIHTEKSESLELTEKERQFSKRSKNKNKKKKNKQNL